MTRGESGRENRWTSRSVRSPGTKMPETAPNEFCISGGEIPPAIGASTTTDVGISWILPTLRLKGQRFQNASQNRTQTQILAPLQDSWPRKITSTRNPAWLTD